MYHCGLNDLEEAFCIGAVFCPSPPYLLPLVEVKFATKQGSFSKGKAVYGWVGGSSPPYGDLSVTHYGRQARKLSKAQSS